MKYGGTTMTQRLNQSIQWWHLGYVQAKEFNIQKSSEKDHSYRYLVFWWLSSEVNAKYYSNLLCQLKEKYWGKLQNGILFLQDNAHANRDGETIEVLMNLEFEHMYTPPAVAPEEQYFND